MHRSTEELRLGAAIHALLIEGAQAGLAGLGGPADKDAKMIAGSGPIGAPAHLMVSAALGAARRSHCYQHRARGPVCYDWLGVVLECCQDVANHIAPIGMAPPLEDWAAYGASWDTGPDTDQASDLFRSWGLVEVDPRRARPGDVLLFAMPRAHAGVLVAGDPQRRTVGDSGSTLSGDGVMVSAQWGRAPAQQWTAPYWSDRLVQVFGWR